MAQRGTHAASTSYLDDESDTSDLEVHGRTQRARAFSIAILGFGPMAFAAHMCRRCKSMHARVPRSLTYKMRPHRTHLIPLFCSDLGGDARVARRERLVGV